MSVFVKSGKDPYGENPEELTEWIGDWNPDEFELEALQEMFDL